MGSRVRSLLLLLALASALLGCAEGPRFAQVAATVPPVPAGAARIFFYRWLEPYETLSWTPVYLNGATVAVSQPGTVLYRDVPPGTYAIAVRSEGVYPGQFKTVAVGPGQVLYVRIESLSSWYSGGGPLRDWQHDTFVVNLVDPETAGRETQDLRYIPG
jgi:hypothetical protein